MGKTAKEAVINQEGLRTVKDKEDWTLLLSQCTHRYLALCGSEGTPTPRKHNKCFAYRSSLSSLSWEKRLGPRSTDWDFSCPWEIKRGSQPWDQQRNKQTQQQQQQQQNRPKNRATESFSDTPWVSYSCCSFDCYWWSYSTHLKNHYQTHHCPLRHSRRTPSTFHFLLRHFSLRIFL